MLRERPIRKQSPLSSFLEWDHQPGFPLLLAFFLIEGMLTPFFLGLKNRATGALSPSLLFLRHSFHTHLLRHTGWASHSPCPLSSHGLVEETATAILEPSVLSAGIGIAVEIRGEPRQGSYVRLPEGGGGVLKAQGAICWGKSRGKDIPGRGDCLN